jgi:hypothetical protein
MLSFAEMKSWASRHRLVVMFAVAIISALGFLEFAPAFNECVQANQAHNPNQPPYEKLPGFLWVQYWCAGVFLHETGDIITAIATVTMAAFTGTLWWSTASTAKLTEKTVDLAEKQHGLARLQHIAANKPFLRIRGINLDPAGPEGSLFEKDKKIKGSLVIANGGATDATIIDSGYRFYWSNNGLPMNPPLESAEVSELVSSHDPIRGYESRSVQIESKSALDVNGMSIMNATPHGWKLYVLGYIHYSDINGAERFMGFCRRYIVPDGKGDSGPDGRFEAVANADYEYQD